MLSRELEVTLNLAFKDARKKRHELMSVEHLLLALLDNTSRVSTIMDYWYVMMPMMRLLMKM